ncbi:MAG: DUF362 domain-containing protein, partial [Dehalococcoidia bacterium]
MSTETRTEEKDRTPETRRVKRSRVSVLYTSPDTVLEDYRRAMELAGVEEHLPKDTATLLKINISWQLYYPACSTPPWQLEGAIKSLQGLGYRELIAAHNGTVVVDAREGEVRNKQKVVVDRFGLPNMHLEEAPVRWVQYRPKARMLVLDDIFPDGIRIPEPFIG